MAPDHPAIQRAVEWLINQEIPIRGDWQIKNPYGPASGWAFEFETIFILILTTAMVLMAIEGARIPNEERRQAVMKRAVEWLLSMQSSDGDGVHLMSITIRKFLIWFPLPTIMPCLTQHR